MKNEVRCRKMREMVSAFVDGELSSKSYSMIKAHLEEHPRCGKRECPRCRIEYKNFILLKALLKDLASSRRSSASFWERVRNRIGIGDRKPE